MAALIELFILGLHMFSDVGLGLSVVRGERGDDPHYLNIVWSLQVVRGGCLWLCACTMAWPASVLTPELLYFLPVAGLTAILYGFDSISIFTCDRHLSQGRLVLLQVGCYLVSMTVVLVWLWLADWPVQGNGAVWH